MAQIDHSLRDHAKFSPSSLENREACAGWESDNKGSVYADAGEKCHEATEAKLRGDDSLQRALTDDLAYSVQEVFDYVSPRIAGCEKMITEQRVYHNHALLKELAHGTPDLVTITGKRGQIFDYKYGRRKVTPAKTNLQGWTYATAVWDTHPEIEELEVHFVAPRVADGTTYAVFTRKDNYEPMLGRVLRTVERANLPDEEKEKLLAASWGRCIFCSKKFNCNKLSECMNEFITEDADETLFSVTKLRETAKTNDKDSLRYQYEFARVAQDWAAQKLDAIKQQALEGAEVAGYELRFTKGRTTLHTLDKVLETVPEINLAEAVKSATIPLVELKRLYTDGLPAEEKSDKENELMTKLASGGALKSGTETCYLYKAENK